MEKVNYLFNFETRKGITTPSGNTLTETTGSFKPVVIRSDPKYSSDYVSKEIKRFSEIGGFVHPHIWSGYLFYEKIVSDEEVKEIFSKWNGGVGDHLIDFPEDGKCNNFGRFDGFYSKNHN